MSPWLRSTLLTQAGFTHVFTTRNGGVSRGPFASLNLARSVGDVSEDVEENYRRVLTELGAQAVYETSQVHGNAVFRTMREAPMLTRQREADGLYADVSGIAVGVRTADCVPILLACKATGAVAAVHAGWRGVAARIIDEALQHFDSPNHIVAAIGPHIRSESFEVGEEVVTALRQSTPSAAEFVVRGHAKPHVDLALVLRQQLAENGVVEVDDIGGDTFTGEEQFFSFRRDGAQSGRMLSAIVARRL